MKQITDYVNNVTYSGACPGGLLLLGLTYLLGLVQLLLTGN